MTSDATTPPPAPTFFPRFCLFLFCFAVIITMYTFRTEHTVNARNWVVLRSALSWLQGGRIVQMGYQSKYTPCDSTTFSFSLLLQHVLVIPNWHSSWSTVQEFAYLIRDDRGSHTVENKKKRNAQRCSGEVEMPQITSYPILFILAAAKSVVLVLLLTVARVVWGEIVRREREKAKCSWRVSEVDASCSLMRSPCFD